jgi:hypothetical protein
MFGNADDPTQGALFYHADYVSPYWKDSMIPVAAIGQHLFYRPEPRSKHAPGLTRSGLQAIPVIRTVADNAL